MEENRSMKYPQLLRALPLVGLGLLASGCERGYGLRPVIGHAFFSTAEERIASYHEQVDRESAERESSEGPAYRPIFVVTRTARPLAPAELAVP